MSFIDFIGYLGSALVVGSFLAHDLRYVRAINFCGCLCFVCYGIGEGMLLPIIVPNAILALIQIMYLKKAFIKARLSEQVYDK